MLTVRVRAGDGALASCQMWRDVVRSSIVFFRRPKFVEATKRGLQAMADSTPAQDAMGNALGFGMDGPPSSVGDVGIGAAVGAAVSGHVGAPGNAVAAVG